MNLRTYALFLLFAACSPPSPEEAPTEFPVALPTREQVDHEREYIAEVQALQRADIQARISGLIKAVAVDEGQQVKRGDLLFSLSSTELEQQVRRTRAAVASARAELRSAEIERTNIQLLFDKKVVAPVELSLAESKLQLLAARVEEARAEQSQAEVNLGYAFVRAPFAGVVGRLARRAGSSVQQGELLTTLTNASDAYVYFRLSEQDYLEHGAGAASALGAQVGLRLANDKPFPAEGTIDAVGTEVDRETGTLTLRARFPNSEGTLKHGSAGKVILKSAWKDALTVPQAATFEVQDQLYVYVVDSDGTARARKIVPKLRLNDVFVVESGLLANERFIATGIQKVKDGEKVSVFTVAPALAKSQL